MECLQVDVDALRDGREKDAAKRGLLDNYDDVEGYYNFQVGEMMDGRYEVFATHGKGVFSTVLRARDKGQVDALGRHPEVMPSSSPPYITTQALSMHF